MKSQVRQASIQESMIYNTLFSCRVKFSSQLNSRNFLYDAIEEGTDIVDGPREFTEADLLNTE